MADSGPEPRSGNCSGKTLFSTVPQKLLHARTEIQMQILQLDKQIIGPWVFGISLDVLLLGVLTVQTYVYYLAFPKDRGLLKLAVIWVYLVGVVQTILALVDLNATLHILAPPVGSCSIHEVIVNHFWLTTIVFSEAAALTAQWLYAYRIYVISHKLWIIILVICLSLGQFGTSIVGCLCLRITFSPLDTLSGGGNPNISLCAPGFGWVWGPLNFLCDITITVSLSILLLKRRNGTLKKTTHAQISRIVRIVVETGLATSVVVVVYTLTYNLPSIFPPSADSTPETAWLIPGLLLGKVYSNSMLALLNSRLTIVGGRNTGDPFNNSEIRSEVLRTEVGGDQVPSPVNRRRITNREDA